LSRCYGRRSSIHPMASACYEIHGRSTEADAYRTYGSIMEYRRDGRSVERFAQDLKDCHRVENQLMTLYVGWLNSRIRNDDKYSFEDNGVDNSGKLLTDKQVTSAADFLLIRAGHSAKHIDIKFCREERKTFHLKVSQLNQYVKNNVAIINYMGSDGENRRFCIIKPDEIKWLLKYGEKVKFAVWGYKECIRCYVNDFEWHKV
jgi:hypothetical protein